MIALALFVAVLFAAELNFNGWAGTALECGITSLVNDDKEDVDIEGVETAISLEFPIKELSLNVTCFATVLLLRVLTASTVELSRTSACTTGREEVSIVDPSPWIDSAESRLGVGLRSTSTVFCSRDDADCKSFSFGSATVTGITGLKNTSLFDRELFPEFTSFRIVLIGALSAVGKLSSTLLTGLL
jgi:hypothetical protein